MSSRHMSGERDLAAGEFSSWMIEMQGAIRGERGADVPCDGCTACCTSSQFIHIEPDETDTLSHIPAELLFPAPRLPRGHVLLGYDERGHCPMLVDNRCSIYEHRPRTCRTYDCRIFPAAGLGIDDDADKVLIARQARRWQFSFPIEADRDQHDAVRAAATFLHEHTGLLPDGAAPTNVTQLAVLAIEIHDAFLRRDEEADRTTSTVGGLHALPAALAGRCEAHSGPAHVDERVEDGTEVVRLAHVAGDLETELLGRRLLVVAHLEAGHVAAVDVEIDAFAAVADRLGLPRFSWYVPLWRGMRALLEGRLDECEQRNAEAATMGGGAQSPDAEALCGVQLFVLRLAQDRVFELEAPLRAFIARCPGVANARARLAHLLGLLGRDGEARAELDHLAAGRFVAVDDGSQWLATIALLAELAAMLDLGAAGGDDVAAREQAVVPEAVVLYDLLVPYARRFAVEGGGAACHGSVSRHLGLLAHTLGRWEAADAHFADALQDNERVGSPLLVANTRAQWSALLRTRDRGDDWERGLDLLAGAEAIYRRLGVDRLAAEASSVLARSHEPPARDRASGANVFRREGDVWVLAYGGREVRLSDASGLRDLSLLLAHPGHSFHVIDLVTGVGRGVGRAGQPRSQVRGSTGEQDAGPVLDAQATAEYRTRLVELEHDLADAEATDDRVAASLARAERDFVAAELASLLGSDGPTPAIADPVERARRAVSTRIRLGLDAIDAAHPALGRHLRHSVRTGTFCSYEPQTPTTWRTEPGL